MYSIVMRKPSGKQRTMNHSVHFKDHSTSREQEQQEEHLLKQQSAKQKQYQQQQKNPQEEDNQGQFIQTWKQRHHLLTKLTPVLLQHHHSIQPNHQQDYHSYTHLQPPSIQHSSLSLSPQFGFIIELAQLLLRDLLPNSDLHSQSQLKLLRRCENAHIDPQKDFTLIRKISEGQSGSVHLIRTRLSSFESLNQSNFYILKTVPKRVSKRIQQYSSIQTELSILLLSRVDECGMVKMIPKLHLAFQTKDELGLVIEFTANGSVTDYLNQANGSIPEEAVLKVWTADVISGLDWLHHSHRFCHRDIKPSNMLINDHGHLLLNDFATAAPLVPSLSPRSLIVPLEYRAVIIGTCDYIAPEVLRVHLTQTIANLNHSSTSNRDESPADNDDYHLVGSYGPEIDFWSFGVSLYELVYGQLPFFCQSISGTYNRIVAHQTYLQVSSVRNHTGDDDQIVHASLGLQNFLKSLICGREARIGCGPEGIEDVRKHEWFQGLDWNELRQSPVLNFINVPLDLNRLGDSVCLLDPNQTKEQNGAGFNFSNFFGSSPGLSALHNDSQECTRTGFFKPHNPTGNHEQENEEDLSFWGFTYLPSKPDEFDQPQEDHQVRLLKSSIKRSNLKTTRNLTPLMADADKFSTPIKPRTGVNNQAFTPGNGFQNSASHPPPTNLVTRSIRCKTGQDGQQVQLSEIDALMELNQFVLWTAKKSSSKRRPSQDVDAQGRQSPVPPLLLNPDNTPQPIDRQIAAIDNQLNLLLAKIDTLVVRSDLLIHAAQPHLM